MLYYLFSIKRVSVSAQTKKKILFTSIVSRPNSGQCELREARKTLIGGKVWRGLKKDYSFVRNLEKLGQRVLVVYKISTKSWGLEVGKWLVELV